MHRSADVDPIIISIKFLGLLPVLPVSRARASKSSPRLSFQRGHPALKAQSSRVLVSDDGWGVMEPLTVAGPSWCQHRMEGARNLRAERVKDIGSRSGKLGLAA